MYANASENSLKESAKQLFSCCKQLMTSCKIKLVQQLQQQHQSIFPKQVGVG
jgi:hypothetical protein